MDHEPHPKDDDTIRLASLKPPMKMEIDSECFTELHAASGVHPEPAIKSNTDLDIHIESHTELKAPSAAPVNLNTLVVSDDEVQITNRRSRRSNAGKPAERLYEGNTHAEIDGLLGDSDGAVKKESKFMKALKTPKTRKASQITEKQGTAGSGRGRRVKDESVGRYNEDDSAEDTDYPANEVPRKRQRTGSAANTAEAFNLRTVQQHLLSEMHVACEIPGPTVLQSMTCNALNAAIKKHGERDGFTELVIACRTCVQRQTFLGACRFKDFRVFNKNVKSKYSFKSTQKPWKLDGGDLPLAPSYLTYGKEKISTNVRNKISYLVNDGNKEAMANKWLAMVAPPFSRKLEQELKHENTAVGILDVGEVFTKRPIVRVEVEVTSRRKCDLCAAGIFFGAYLCGGCGTEFCLDCWEQFDKLTEVRKSGRGVGSVMSRCSSKVDHKRPSFYLLTTAFPGEVQSLLETVKEQISHIPESATPIFIPQRYEEGNFIAPVLDMKDREASTSYFHDLWRQGGIPVVVKGVTDSCSLPWSPSYFNKTWGDTECLLFDCSFVDSTTRQTTDGIIEATVGQFMGGYETFALDHEKRKPRPWKIKDWPPTAEMRETFPDLFQDFENVVPFPEHTTRKGPFNLCSHLPDDAIKPDLGPKMYLAYPTADFLNPNYKGPILGSTNLHLDITDAVNILMHVSKNGPPNPKYKELPEGTGAIWDIFPPSAADPIRAYLQKTRKEYVDDPIHRQCFYLTDKDISKLDPKDRPYRIYQKKGEAVFIPAGCPHQVRNVRSCIKIAVDFFSAENTEVSSRLAAEARGLCGINAVLNGVEESGPVQLKKKEDVLGMYMSLYYAWKGLESMKTGQWIERSMPDTIDTHMGLDSAPNKGRTKNIKPVMETERRGQSRNAEATSEITVKDKNSPGQTPISHQSIKEETIYNNDVDKKQSPRANDTANLVKKARRYLPTSGNDSDNYAVHDNNPPKEAGVPEIGDTPELQQAYMEGGDFDNNELKSLPDELSKVEQEEEEEKEEEEDYDMMERPQDVVPETPTATPINNHTHTAIAAVGTPIHPIVVNNGSLPAVVIPATRTTSVASSVMTLNSTVEPIVIDDGEESGSIYGDDQSVVSAPRKRGRPRGSGFKNPDGSQKRPRVQKKGKTNTSNVPKLGVKLETPMIPMSNPYNNLIPETFNIVRSGKPPILECQNGHCVKSKLRNLPRDVVHLPCGHLICVDCIRSMFLLLPTLGHFEVNGPPSHCGRPIPLQLVDELLHDDEKKTYNDWVRG